MATVTMRALKPFSYRGTRFKKGDILTVKEGDVALLNQWQFVEKAPPKQVYRTRDMAAPTWPAETWPGELEAKPPLSSYTKPRLQAMLDERKIKWRAWESKATLIAKLSKD